MRVVVTGATGNVGTSLLRALAAEREITSILGIARRPPRARYPKTEFAALDVSRDDLTSRFRGADAVVHLAWLIQPSRNQGLTGRVNVDGSRRVFEAVAGAGVPALVYASSVGAYSPGPKDAAVDESWPTEGIPTSFYSRHKAEVERVLEAFAATNPSVRVALLRPGLIFKGEAGSEIRRLFAGPLFPPQLARRGLIPAVPDLPRLRFQAVHTDDVADAYRLAVVRDVRGAFNIAAPPVLDPAGLADLLGARRVPVRAGVLRALVDATWRLRLQPTPPGWLDMALAVPIMATGRAESELRWRPRFSAGEALLELLEGIRRSAGAGTPPLRPGGQEAREFPAAQIGNPGA
jgi:UDP-glucose 4-epimerase